MNRRLVPANSLERHFLSSPRNPLARLAFGGGWRGAAVLHTTTADLRGMRVSPAAARPTRPPSETSPHPGGGPPIKPSRTALHHPLRGTRSRTEWIPPEGGFLFSAQGTKEKKWNQIAAIKYILHKEIFDLKIGTLETRGGGGSHHDGGGGSTPPTIGFRGFPYSPWVVTLGGK